MEKSVSALLEMARNGQFEMVDLKFSSLIGRMHHITIPAGRLTADTFEKGVPFDGSSVPGFKKVNSGDMTLVPDPSTAMIDGFWDRATLSLLCDIKEADSLADYSRDPRFVARRAEAYMRELGIADESLWSPEFEFHMFDSVQFDEGENCASYMIESQEAGWFANPENSDKLGHKIPHQSGYHACMPQDAYFNIRSEMASRIEAMGVDVRYHHHEVGSTGQSEIEIGFNPLTQAGDIGTRIKYIIKMIAKKHGKTATFMPKPLFYEAGNGMHFHQVLRKGGENLFYDKEGYAELSQTALYYIGGILKHGRALLAFTNPSTNSYKRLVPGFEAPTQLFFGLANRSAAIRIPRYAKGPDQLRFEFRPPDGTCNLYLAMTAQLMAGLDGIRNKIDPVANGWGPIDENIEHASEEVRSKISRVPESLEEAMLALKEDYEFLLEGDVFTKDLIEAWIDYKMTKEFNQVRNRPHPHEMLLYYDA